MQQYVLGYIIPDNIPELNLMLIVKTGNSKMVSKPYKTSFRNKGKLQNWIIYEFRKCEYKVVDENCNFVKIEHSVTYVTNCLLLNKDNIIKL